MDINEKMFDKEKIKAPDGFAKNTMEYIYQQEMADLRNETTQKSPSFNPPYLKLGKAMVMAAVLLMIFNILPTFGGISVSNAQSDSYITYNINTKENVYDINFDNSDIKEFCKDFKYKINFDFKKGDKNE